MKAELKQEWIRRLRSGEYSQTRGVLKRSGFSNGHCCLGVLCDILDPKGWSLPHSLDKCQWQDMSFTQIPTAWRLEIGLKTGDMVYLQCMNDGGHSDDEPIPRKSFVGIADWIEENVEVTA